MMGRELGPMCSGCIRKCAGGAWVVQGGAGGPGGPEGPGGPLVSRVILLQCIG